MTIRKVWMVALAGAALASGAALAGGHGRHGGHGEHFKAMDTDGNGSISQAEADAFFNAKAAAIDANRDGTITVEEVQAYHQAQRRQRMADHLAMLDTNKDGKLSTAEFAQSGSKRVMERDTDANGEVAKGEGRRRHRGGDR